MGSTRAIRAACCTGLASVLVSVSAPFAVADQIRDDQWALKELNAGAVWNVSRGSGVTVAVIDDGVNANHVDLKGNVLAGKDFMGDGSTVPKPGDDHGTAMAAIIAGHGHGVDEGVIGLAPEAKILPVREFGLDGPGFPVAIRYAVDNGASVINVSQCLDSTDQSELDRTSEAVAYALAHDVLVIGGSGNDGNSSKCYPAASPGALGVGALNDDGMIWKGSNSGSHLLLAAPGVDVVSVKGTGQGYRIGTGTSDAAAYVTATAALLRAKFPDLTAGQIANRMVKTAVLPDADKGLSTPDKKYGYGSIQPLAALTKDIPAGSKYGPLSVPESLQAKKAGPQIGMSDEEQAAADRKAMIAWAVVGVVGLVAIGLVVLLVVKLSRRKKNNVGGPGGRVRPADFEKQGQQPFPPQQNPYHQQPTHTSGQWPPQQ
ncbi:S8 family serine peptidase [Streptomyces pathocidini]|uniref:S8 family serine peptidase n=1 Tax=Streptomyces pathocidini TaxID=1650571 RepID=UPI0033DFB989